MEYIYIFLGVLFIIAGLAFFFGRTHIQLFAWENMPEQGRGRIMPLCRCIGEVIVLSGLIFPDEGLVGRLFGTLACRLHSGMAGGSRTGCLVHSGEQTLPAIIICTAALRGRVRF